MGKLIKNHWARLIILAAATCTTPSPPLPRVAPLTPPDQVAAAIHGFFWPKVFWDFLTKNLDPAVKPVPILQTFNLLFGVFALAFEWPLPLLSGTALHRSIEARLVGYPLFALAALLMYQGTNAGLYYLIGVGVYFWAFAEGEVCSPSSHDRPASGLTDSVVRRCAHYHGPYPGRTRLPRHDQGDSGNAFWTMAFWARHTSGRAFASLGYPAVLRASSSIRPRTVDRPPFLPLFYNIWGSQARFITARRWGNGLRPGIWDWRRL